MNISDYRKQYLELEQKAKRAKQDFETFKTAEHKDFYELYRKEQEEHLNWFAEHFNYFQKHKEYIKNSPVLSKIVIDFMPLYRGGGLISGAGFSICSNGYKIYLGDLLKIWDSGFCFEGYPIVFCEFGMHFTTNYIVKYIKNNRIETAKRTYKGHQWFLPELDKKLYEELKKANINKKFPDMSTYRTIELVMKIHEREKSIKFSGYITL